MTRLRLRRRRSGSAAWPRRSMPFTAFFGFGWVIGDFTGNTTDKGFNLDGAPALLLFAIVVAYSFHLAAATPAARSGTASSASAGRSRKHRRLPP